jgi:aspartate aminotransferase
MKIISERIRTLNESATLAMARKSRELTAQGKDVINLSLGEPDFNTPDFIKEAAIEALKENYTKYTPVNGYLDLREAISQKFKRDNNLHYTPDQIVVSTGAKQSIANVVLSLINPGDEVIIPTPFWVSYQQIVELAGGSCKFIKTNLENNFKITPQQLSQSISSKSKLIMFSSPCNPTGSVYSEDELNALAEVVAAHHQLMVLSDEIYEYINFTGKHYSIARHPKIYNRVITVNGVSKGFAMTGWRIGYMGASKEIAEACTKTQGQFTSGTCSIAQKAAKAAILANPEITTPMRQAFQKRRDLIVTLLKEIPGVKCNVPEGAFYVFPEINSYFGKSYNGKTINTAEDLSMYLLTESLVAVVTGEAFGDNNCIRLSYATSEELIIKAVDRIKNALQKLT